MALPSLLLCLFYQDVFPEPLFRLQVSMFSEKIVCGCVVARDGNCQIFPLNFQWAFN